MNDKKVILKCTNCTKLNTENAVLKNTIGQEKVLANAYHNALVAGSNVKKKDDFGWVDRLDGDEARVKLIEICENNAELAGMIANLASSFQYNFEYYKKLEVSNEELKAENAMWKTRWERLPERIKQRVKEHYEVDGEYIEYGEILELMKELERGGELNDKKSRESPNVSRRNGRLSGLLKPSNPDSMEKHIHVWSSFGAATCQSCGATREYRNGKIVEKPKPSKEILKSRIKQDLENLAIMCNSDRQAILLSLFNSDALDIGPKPTLESVGYCHKRRRVTFMTKNGKSTFIKPEKMGVNRNADK